MAAAELDQLLLVQWENVVELSKKTLEEDIDRHRVMTMQSWEGVQDQLKGDSNHAGSAMLRYGVSKLQDFTEKALRIVIPELDHGILWGFCRLLVELVQMEEASMARVPRLLRSIGYQVEALGNYCKGTQTTAHSLKAACVECTITVLSFLSNTVNFLRGNVRFVTPGDSMENEWQPLSIIFTSTTTELDNILSRVERMSGPLQQMHTPIRPHSPGIEPSAHRQCWILPAGYRVNNFFNRDEIMQKLDAFFQEPSFQPLRSIALHGLGGVGKSSIALHYAEQKLQDKKIDALFWIQGQTSVSMKQSFTAIAFKLKLPNAQHGDYDENVALVLDWLMQTRCRWLLIYDNVESVDVINAHWPRAAHGKIIITSRNHNFEYDPAQRGLEILTWDNDEGSRFLFHLLGTDIGSEIIRTDKDSAHRLSTRMSGHALALSHMAGLIHKRRWSITKFMEVYEQHPYEMQGVSGNRAINALWDLSFRSLSAESRKILGILSYMAPDSIPETIFEAKAPELLPDRLKFCSNIAKVYDAVEELQVSSLVRYDETSHSYSLHRLVQTSFKYSMTPEEKQEAWWDTVALLSNVFPRRGSTVAQLYLMWDRCSLYLQHVLSLKDAFREEKASNPSFKALQIYCDLNNACQRYLLEITSYTELKDLIEVNTMAMATLPAVDQTLYDQAALTSHKGQLLVRTGKVAEGVVWLKRSYEFSYNDQPFDGREAAWGAQNYANGVGTLNDYSEAIEWHEKAHKYWGMWANTQTTGTISWPATLQKSMATALLWAGRNIEARIVAEAALQQVETLSPYNWAVAAYTHFVLASIDRADRKFEAAEAHLMEAQNKWLRGEQIRTDPFNAACMYRLGCVALDQGKIEAAIKNLQDCRLVTDLRKSIMLAEHARCLFKLSEALEQDPHGVKNAIRYREEAENLLRELNPAIKPAEAGLERSYDEQIHIQWR